MTARDTKIIVAEVIAVIPEYEQVAVEANGGWQYSITKRNVGWDTLVEGDMVELEVYTAVPIVKEIKSVNKS